jgi:cell wall-associated NlpC family hydrolase
VGDSYVAGRTGPNAFDCSGLTRFVLQRAVGRSLPHYSKAQYSVTKRVSRKNLKPGDLVFFFKYGAHHVGMYIGNGKMVHAANPRADVRVDHVFRGWYGKHYSGAGRVIKG